MDRPPRSRARDHYEYRRAYKACIPCRQRKVKCRPTDESSQPCSRCKNMGLECSFTEKLPWSREKQSSEPPRFSDATSKYSQQQQNFSFPAQDVPCIINGRSARSTAILKQPVSSSSDALDILFKTAHDDSGTTTPTISGGEKQQQKHHAEVPNPDAIRIWNACRFVKMGWFTANEAIDLVNLSVSECDTIQLNCNTETKQILPKYVSSIANPDGLLCLIEESLLARYSGAYVVHHHSHDLFASPYSLRTWS